MCYILLPYAFFVFTLSVRAPTPLFCLKFSFLNLSISFPLTSSYNLILFPSSSFSTASFLVGHGAALTEFARSTLQTYVGPHGTKLILLSPLFLPVNSTTLMVSSLTQLLHPWPYNTSSQTSSSATSCQPWSTPFILRFSTSNLGSCVERPCVFPLTSRLLGAKKKSILAHVMFKKKNK